VSAWDDKPDAVAASASAGIPTENLDLVNWRGFAALVLTPGVPLTHPEPAWPAASARAAGIEIIGDIELFCRERRRFAPNAPPAAIFMGDTGSLPLGGALGVVAVAVKHEIVLALVGGLFVVETVSVIVQVISFKLTGKRVFRMAPIHHHYEQLGWTEPTIVIRFWIVAVVLALLGLATLKLR
jgi:hypothetical protein